LGHSFALDFDFLIFWKLSLAKAGASPEFGIIEEMVLLASSRGFLHPTG